MILTKSGIKFWGVNYEKNKQERKNKMNKEKELANGIYIMLENKKNGFTKDMQTETIGKLMLEARKNTITKTLSYLFSLYLKDIARENRNQIKSNKDSISEAENLLLKTLMDGG